MSLARAFLSCAPEGRRDAFAVVPQLDRALARLAAAGRSAWSEIPLPDADFASFLGRCLPSDTSLDPGSLRAADLYLVCAYDLGIPAAAAALEEHYLSRVASVLARIGIDPATTADVCQEMRSALLQMANPPPGRKVYAGRGALLAWLRVSAVRAANRRRDRSHREVPLESFGPAILGTASDPEMEYLQRSHKRELDLAFREALAALSSRERNLLRYHFVDRLSIDQIGAIYRVHRSTAARWVERARRALCERTREGFCRRVSISQEGFQRVLALIASQLSVHLAAAPAE